MYGLNRVGLNVGRTNDVRNVKIVDTSLFLAVAVVLRVMSVVDVLDVSVEPVVLVGGVRHLPDAAVRFDQAVLAVHDVAVPVLRLMVVVARVRVLDAVFVRVVRRRLRRKRRSH